MPDFSRKEIGQRLQVGDMVIIKTVWLTLTIKFDKCQTVAGFGIGHGLYHRLEEEFIRDPTGFHESHHCVEGWMGENMFQSVAL